MSVVAESIIRKWEVSAKELSFDKSALLVEFGESPVIVTDLYRSLHAVSECIVRFRQNLAGVFLDGMEFHCYVDGFQIGSLFTFLKDDASKETSSAFVELDRNEATKFLQRSSSILLSFLADPEEASLSDWNDVADQINQLAASMSIPSQLVSPSIDARFLLEESKEIGRRLSKVSGCDVFYMDSSAVVECKSRKAVNDDYIIDVLSDVQELVYEGSIWLQVKKPDLKGQSRWDFIWNGEKISAKIVNFAWLSKVKSDKYRFGAESQLFVQIKAFGRKEDLNFNKSKLKYIIDDVIDFSGVEEM